MTQEKLVTLARREAQNVWLNWHDLLVGNPDDEQAQENERAAWRDLVELDRMYNNIRGGV